MPVLELHGQGCNALSAGGILGVSSGACCADEFKPSSDEEEDEESDEDDDSDIDEDEEDDDEEEEMDDSEEESGKDWDELEKEAARWAAVWVKAKT